MADSRDKKNQYMEALKTQLSGVSPQNASDGGVSPEDQDYYTMLKNESYKTMLSKEVQAYNAQEQARKYTNNALMANGYGTQGLSESSQLGIGNAYRTALKDAQNEYDNAILNIDQQQAQETNDDFESLATLLGSANSTSQLAEVLGNYGYMKDGQWTDAFEGLDTRTKNQLKTLYSLYSSQFENNEWLSDNTLNGTGYRDSNSAIQNVVTDDGSNGAVISNELRHIFSEDFIKGKEDGYCVKLVNGNNDKQFAYMIYRNGTWYQTTANVYNNAEAKQKEVLKGKD